MLKIFFKFFFSKIFFYENSFRKIFLMKIFFENFFHEHFFRENFFRKIFVMKIFFEKFFFVDNFSFYTNISFVFDVCEIMYFANFVIRNFAYCEFFVLQFWCTEKNCQFFLQFFFQRWTWIPNLKMFLFWKKVKFSLIVLLDTWNKKLFVCIKVYYSV